MKTISFSRGQVRRCLASLCLAGLGLWSVATAQVSPAVEGFNGQWLVRKQITNLKPTGALNTVLTNFPFLLRLSNDTAVKSSLLSDGGDITFVGPDGRQLFHEIESIDRNNGHLTAWVCLPQFTVQSWFYLYTSNASSGSMTFSGSNFNEGTNLTGLSTLRTRAISAKAWHTNYLVVLHFADSNDSTRYGNNLDVVSNSTFVQAGQNGSAGAAFKTTLSAGNLGWTNIMPMIISNFRMTNSAFLTNAIGLPTNYYSTFLYFQPDPAVSLTNQLGGGSTPAVPFMNVRGYNYFTYNPSGNGWSASVGGQGTYWPWGTAGSTAYGWPGGVWQGLDTVLYVQNCDPTSGTNIFYSMFSNGTGVAGQLRSGVTGTFGTGLGNLVVLGAQNSVSTSQYTPAGLWDEFRLALGAWPTNWVQNVNYNMANATNGGQFTLSTNEILATNAVAPLLNPSGSLSTNAVFTAWISCVQSNTYWSTNGGLSWNAITAAASSNSILIATGTTLQAFSSNRFGAVSATNSVNYAFSVPVVLVNPQSLSTNVTSMSVSLRASGNYGYVSLTGSNGPYSSFNGGFTNVTVSVPGTITVYGDNGAGAVSTTNVYAYGYDVALPQVFVYPATGSNAASTGLTVTLGADKGTVYSSTNGVSFTAVPTWTFAATNTNAAWTNVLASYAVDASGNVSATNTNFFYFNTILPVPVATASFTNSNATAVSLSFSKGQIFWNTNAAAQWTNGVVTNAEGSTVNFQVGTGTTTLRAYAVDAFSNVSPTWTYTYVVRTNGPLIGFSAALGTRYTNATNFVFWVTNDASRVAWYTNVNSNATPVFTLSTNLSNVVSNVTAPGAVYTNWLWTWGVDGGGNITPTNRISYVVDVALPVVTSTRGQTNRFVAPVATNTVDKGFLVWSTNAGSTWATNGAGSPVFLTASNQRVQQIFWAFDAAGNVTPTNTNVYWQDTNGPALTYSPNAFFYKNPITTLSLIGDKTNVFWRTNLSGAFNLLPVVGTNLAVSNTTTLQWWGVDFLSNITPTNSFTFTIDPNAVSTRPTVLWVGPTNGTATNAAFTLSLYANRSNGFFTSNAGTNWISWGAGVTNLTVNGTSTWAFFGVDAYSNYTATNTLSYVFSTVPPVLSGLLPSLVTNAPFTLSLSVDRPAAFWSTNVGITATVFSNATTVVLSNSVLFATWTLDQVGNGSATNVNSYQIIYDAPKDDGDRLTGVKNGQVLPGFSFTLGFASTGSGVYTMEIANLSGQRVRTLGTVSGEINLSTKQITFDGNADSGKKIVPGVYVLVLKKDGVLVDQRRIVLTGY